MTILIGHPTGSPNAHHAALAHFERGRLEVWCVSWVPSAVTLACLGFLPGTLRLARRRFTPLNDTPLIQGRVREWMRLGRRLAGGKEAQLAADANEWLMRIMRDATARPRVTAVHAFEDCALLPFDAAKARSQACIYDMPIAYYPYWQKRQAELMHDYADWLPAVRAADPVAPLAQKRREMQLADVVLAPCRFAEATIRAEIPDKKIVLAPYGVDATFWSPAYNTPPRDALRFIFAGQISLRKGMPDLIKAWRKADLHDAELELVGSWHLADHIRALLPRGIVHRPPCAPEELRARYRAADVFVFPSHFEGYGLALVEAMACGLPVLASDAGIAPEIITPDSGRVIAAGDIDALVDNLRWFASHRGDLKRMGQAARMQASQLTWPTYREAVSNAVAPYL